MNTIYTITSEIRGGGIGSRAWVARIDGTDEKFGLRRVFVNADKSGMSRSGRSGHIDFNITEPGIYEFRGVQHGAGQATIGDTDSGFISVDADGTVTAIDKPSF